MSEESKFLGVTIRGWIALIIVSTVCAISTYSCVVFKVAEIKEPLYTLVISAVSFYLGSKNSTMMKTGDKPNGTA